MRLHLDTDIGGDMDDLCALAMILNWPDLTITGITTVVEDQGHRAGYVRYALNLAGRSDIPVAAGADVAGDYYSYRPDYPPAQEYWPEPIPALPGSLDDALALLASSIEQGAMIVAIGPYTNLALLDQQYPGILQKAHLWLMGGRIYPIPVGYPQWGDDSDYNIQLDTRSAQYVLAHSNPTIVPMTVTVQTALRYAYLPALSSAGRLGQLIVRQAHACAAHDQVAQRYGSTCPELPVDIINFQHDPLACAIALGWRAGVDIETVPLRYEIEDGLLRQIPDQQGRPTRVVIKIDGPAFNEFWRDIACRYPDCRRDQQGPY